MSRAKRAFRIPFATGEVFDADAGDVLRIIALDGAQGVDLIAFNRRDMRESFSTWLTRHASGSFTSATEFYSKLPAGRLMFSTVTDKAGLMFLSPGRCNRITYEKLLGLPDHPNCQDILAGCVERLGLDPFDVPEVLNLFFTATFRPDGTYDYVIPDVKPGDSIDLRVHMDLTIAISNCPNDLHYGPGPLGIEILTGPG